MHLPGSQVTFHRRPARYFILYLNVLKAQKGVRAQMSMGKRRLTWLKHQSKRARLGVLQKNRVVWFLFNCYFL